VYFGSGRVLGKGRPITGPYPKPHPCPRVPCVPMRALFQERAHMADMTSRMTEEVATYDSVSPYSDGLLAPPNGR
jgi:hypothetical protein